MLVPLIRPRLRASTLRRLGAGTAALAVGWTLSSCSGSPVAAPAYDTVSRGTVSTGVTASGALAAASTEEVGFAQGGKLTKVSVKVGQKVSEGDVLARIDSTSAKKALDAAQANLEAQAASLAKSSDDPSIQSAAASLEQAKVVVSKTAASYDAIEDADRAAISRAKTQRSVDEDAEDDANDAVDAAQEACDTAKGQATDAAKAAQAAIGDPDQATTASALATTAAAAASAAGSACGAVGSAQAGATAAKQRVTADTTTVVAAEHRLDVDCKAGHLAVASATQGVVTARNAYNAAVKARPHTLDQQGALLNAAEAQVDAAQKAVDDTTLRAPSDGTVAAVNGSKGEFVGASTGTSALAPGSSAAIPGASGAAGASAAAGAASVTRPGGTQFIVLSNLDKLQVVLPFEESDAAQIKKGQPVDVQLDALPDLEVHGTVVSIAPTATPISGVISYYATVALDQRDPRERDGQSARVTVLTQQATDVLTVPNNAVRQQGDTSTVTVFEPNGAQDVVTIQTGIVGPDRTEVVSGLTEGQRVVVPSHP